MSLQIVGDWGEREKPTTSHLQRRRVYTMTQPFLKGRLQQQNIKTIVPDAMEQKIIHNVIFKELCQGIINDNSRRNYLSIIQRLQHQGAEAVILGCTRITASARRLCFTTD